ncbi:MAG: calcium-binding protein [Pseudomonadota bacterium]
MKRLTFAAGLTICTATLVAGAVFAKPGGLRSDISFEKLDADGNGQITRTELEGLRARTMASADTNRDGGISLEELEVWGATRAKTHARKMMDRLDANADGVLQPEELKSGKRATRMFDRMDANSDGTISEAEFEAARDRMAKRRAKTD